MTKVLDSDVWTDNDEFDAVKTPEEIEAIVAEARQDEKTALLAFLTAIPICIVTAYLWMTFVV